MLKLETMRVQMEKMVRRMQDTICEAIERLDGRCFREDVWARLEGGGGTSRLLQNGNVFEKAGVNVSVVSGTLSNEGTNVAMGSDGVSGTGNLPFFAAGLSLVLHPHNPMAPIAHANYRYFELGEKATPSSWWFGGGSDLTPAYLFDEDATHFHRVHKEVCDRHDSAFYPRFKKWCDEYFYIAHRGESRGVGGIFFDHLNDRDPESLFAFVTSCAEAFIPAYLPIVERRKDTPFTAQHKRWQQLRRGRYVEFNLIYDRGTSFGLKTGGRVESILISLPPVACWEYDYHPSTGSQEARTLEILKSPREWL